MRRPLRRRGPIGEFLSALSGTWIGAGHGEYPAIDSFDYREVLRLELHETDPILNYEQRTWRDDGGVEVPSHWEAGFLRLLGQGRIELVDSQSGGRVEALSGAVYELVEADGTIGWEFDVKTASHANSPGMRGSTRTWRLTADELTYEMHMATERVPDLQLHVRCRLARD